MLPGDWYQMISHNTILYHFVEVNIGSHLIVLEHRNSCILSWGYYFSLVSIEFMTLSNYVSLQIPIFHLLQNWGVSLRVETIRNSKIHVMDRWSQKINFDWFKWCTKINTYFHYHQLIFMHCNFLTKCRIWIIIFEGMLRSKTMECYEVCCSFLIN